MKRTKTIWIAVAFVATGFMLGCGGEKKEKSSNATSAADGPAAVAPTTQVPVANASTPTDAVTSFLQALRDGDKTTTEALLTAKARQETAAHDLVVEPPGAPTATFSVGRVQQEEGAAYVSCIWTEQEDESEFEVVWILRQEEQGWRVAGMATQLPDHDEPVILNFEDLSELEDRVEQAEMAERQPAGAPQQSGATVR